MEAWRGGATAFPRYVISPHHVVEHDGEVAVLGHTTGSHLGLPDGEEGQLSVAFRRIAAVSARLPMSTRIAVSRRAH